MADAHERCSAGLAEIQLSGVVNRLVCYRAAKLRFCGKSVLLGDGCAALLGGLRRKVGCFYGWEFNPPGPPCQGGAIVRTPRKVGAATVCSSPDKGRPGGVEICVHVYVISASWILGQARNDDIPKNSSGSNGAMQAVYVENQLQVCHVVSQGWESTGRGAGVAQYLQRR